MIISSHMFPFETGYSLKLIRLLPMDLKSELSTVCSRLKTLSKDTEDEFLSLGANLQTFLELNRQNAANAQSVIEMIESGSGLNVGEFTDLFDQAFQEMKGIDAVFSEVTVTQNRLLDRISRILVIRKVLEKTHRYLRMLAVFIKMEIARADHQEFYAVVESLEELAARILENAEQIDSAIQATMKKVTADKEIVKRLAGFKSMLLTDRFTRLDLIEKEGDSIEKTMETCRKTSELSELTTTDIGTVVSKLQFHDISRQQVEHVVETLEEVISGLPEQTAERSEETDPIYQWGVESIEIQIAHMKHVLTETRETANVIASAFGNISRRITSQASETREALKNTFSDSEAKTVMDSQLQDLSECLTESKNLALKVIETVADINDFASSLPEYIKRIENDRFGLKVMTANAIIKAARSGRRGKALGVITNEISYVSKNIQQEISEREDEIKNIVDTSKVTIDSLSDSLFDKLFAVDEIFYQTQDTLQKLLAGDQTVSRVREISQKLETDFSQLEMNVQFDRIIESCLLPAVDHLRAVQGEMKAHLPADWEPGSGRDGKMASVEKRYTMERERTIHMSIYGNEDNETAGDQTSQVSSEALEIQGSDIELFDDEPVEESIGTTELFDSGPTDNGFGSSDTSSYDETGEVELFTSEPDDQPAGNVELFDNDTINVTNPVNGLSTDNPETDISNATGEEEPEHEKSELGDNVELF